MRIILPILAYSIYAAFWCRIIFHALVWYRAAGRELTNPSPVSPPTSGVPLSVYAEAAVDIVFFRRLFETNRLLWVGSWTFHFSFLFVLLRHLIYFMNPVPGCISALQPLGVYAGYVLPLSLISILVIRVAGREKYVSRSNFLIFGLVFLIGITGLLMHVFRPDLVDVKGFIMGILMFRPELVPHSFLFFSHFLLVLLLAPYLPFHIFASPIIILEARQRQEGLKMVLHEK
jgi:nitrate reductase gamma subunit